jgi:hypothetical protein
MSWVSWHFGDGLRRGTTQPPCRPSRSSSTDALAVHSGGERQPRPSASFWRTLLHRSVETDASKSPGPAQGVASTADAWRLSDLVARGSQKCRAQQLEQARRPAALAAKHTEPHAAASAIAACDRTRSGAEQRARMTAIASVAAAQYGTYACARGPQAPSASGSTRHTANPPHVGDWKLEAGAASPARIVGRHPEPLFRHRSSPRVRIRARKLTVSDPGPGKCGRTRERAVRGPQHSRPLLGPSSALLLANASHSCTLTTCLVLVRSTFPSARAGRVRGRRPGSGRRPQRLLTSQRSKSSQLRYAKFPACMSQ